MSQSITRENLYSILNEYDTRIARTERALAAVQKRPFVGPFIIASGNLNPASSSVTSVTHNFGSTAYDLVISEQIDGGWGYFVNWILANKGVNDVTFAWTNLHSAITANMMVKFFLRPNG
jgi:hypothetical protein